MTKKPVKKPVKKPDDDAAEFRARLTQLDKGDLDNESDFQVKLTKFYAEGVAKAEKAHSESENALKLVMADLELKIRSSPESYDLKDKPTEGSIKAVLACSPKVQAAEQAVIDAKYKVGIMKAGMSTVDSRKRAIENLIKLLELSYWAAPKGNRH